VVDELGGARSRCDARQRQCGFGRWPDKAVHGEAPGGLERTGIGSRLKEIAPGARPLRAAA
jgi:hypothetical protein